MTPPPTATATAPETKVSGRRSRSGCIFRAVWPITDESVSYASLCREAERELPLLLARAHSRAVGGGRFSIAPAERVPGSGNITESVLIYECLAEHDGKERPWKRAVA